MADPNDQDLLNKLAENYNEHKGKLQDLGKTALRKSLNDHFTKENPDNTREVQNLVELNLSRYCLINVFENLMNNDLIVVCPVQNNVNPLVLDNFGSCVLLQNMGIFLGVSSYANVYKKDVKESFKKVGLKVNAKGKLKSGSVPYKTIEKNIGFKSVMNNYALQVAGLMYVACHRNDVKFWESFKPYMNLVNMDGYVGQYKASIKLEKKWKYVVEAAPGYCGCLTEELL